MNRIQRFIGLILSFVAVCIAKPATSVIPEPGMWWNDAEPGRGYYFDVQGSTLFFTAFAYDDDGRPTFYAGSGAIVEGFGEVLGTGYPYFSGLGYEPWHVALIDLFRTEGGACLTCLHRPANATAIGRVELYFDKVSSTHMLIIRNDGRSYERILTRLNYWYVPIAPSEPGTPVWLPDLMGDWLFVDTLNRTVPPWRFNFTRREQSVAVITQNATRPWEVRLFDDARQAKLVCRGEPGGLNPLGYPSACQMFINDEPIFWAKIREDVGLDRIQAGYGAVPRVSEAYRGPGIILGFRVE